MSIYRIYAFDDKFIVDFLFLILFFSATVQYAMMSDILLLVSLYMQVRFYGKSGVAELQKIQMFGLLHISIQSPKLHNLHS